MMTAMVDSNTLLEEARELDRTDALAEFRSQFHIPHVDAVEDLYLVGNSLGLVPKRTADYVQEELSRWANLGVRGHFTGSPNWASYHECLAKPMSELVGATAAEVIAMNTLTVNLHLMMATFYRPTEARSKILIEAHAFPSDKNAVESQIQLHGFSASEALLEVQPNDRGLLETETICELIDEQADSLALILLPGVQYYTGQVLDMKAIAQCARRNQVVIGFDLAHAVGNVAMELHDWEVDFACWCTYKYLNSGPGSLAGCFVHERHARNTSLPRLAGWWGHEKATRFQMTGDFNPIPTAEGWQLSNPPILSLAAIRASLDVFSEAGGMGVLVEKSKTQGAYFRRCLEARLGNQVQAIAPSTVSGCQLSLEVKLEGIEGRSVYEALEEKGVRTDWREPNVIRAAPTPLYNRYEEIWKFVDLLVSCLRS
ncbi:MAG: kynureninase [Mariniblastus sp.]|nr:kynureninase [Mariniblastus sp.]